ncbi:YbbR-like domain-containing protein [candidate division KSB1 bacterium]|nr:YbbR-like domain-containing protein [candidate division KSB1 bacterium]
MKIPFHIPVHWLNYHKVKLLSLCSALFLWFYVVTDNIYEYPIQVPIQASIFPEDKVLLKPLPDEAKVLFSGTGKSFLSQSFRVKRLDLDLSDAEDVSTIQLEADMIRGIPRGDSFRPIRVLKPDSIMIYLDTRKTKRIPVEPQFSIDLTDGYTQVGGIMLEPDSITLSGPAQIVDQIEIIKTSEKQFISRSKPVRGKVKLIPPESDMVQVSELTSEYTIDVQRIHEITIDMIPIQVINAPSSVKITVVPSTLSLKLRGGVDLLMQISSDDIQATIDYRTRNRYRPRRIPASIEVPPGISFSNAKPEDFELIIER